MFYNKTKLLIMLANLLNYLSFPSKSKPNFGSINMTFVKMTRIESKTNLMTTSYVIFVVERMSLTGLCHFPDHVVNYCQWFNAYDQKKCKRR